MLTCFFIARLYRQDGLFTLASRLQIRKAVLETTSLFGIAHGGER